MTPKQALTNFLDSEEFDNLMQDYRHCPFTRQDLTILYFEKVKTRLLEVVDTDPKSCRCGRHGVYQLPNGDWVCYDCFSDLEMML